MAKKNMVTGALVIAKREDGSDLYLYEGAEFPSGGLKDGELERFVELGFVAEADVPDEDESSKPAKKSAASK